MQIVLVRHGLPERMEVAVGVADPPLTALGLRQAKAVAGSSPTNPSRPS